MPISSSGVLVSISTLATAAIDAIASPLKPRVEIKLRSSCVLILEVAWDINTL